MSGFKKAMIRHGLGVLLAVYAPTAIAASEDSECVTRQIEVYARTCENPDHIVLAVFHDCKIKVPLSRELATSNYEKLKWEAETKLNELYRRRIIAGVLKGRLDRACSKATS